jgi:hypothetical protein
MIMNVEREVFSSISVGDSMVCLKNPRFVYRLLCNLTPGDFLASHAGSPEGEPIFIMIHDYIYIYTSHY